MKLPINFRRAQVTDSIVAVELIYSSGTSAFEYGFSCKNYKAVDFLGYAFQKGGGFFGWRNHTVAIIDETVVGIGAFYNGTDYLRLSVELVWQILCFYPWYLVPSVFWHILQLQSLMPKPSRTMHYIANFAVQTQWRGQKIGTDLLYYQQEKAKQLGRKTYALDVAMDNPRAQMLYERLGFYSIRKQKFTGKKGYVTDTLRMEKSIGH